MFSQALCDSCSETQDSLFDQKLVFLLSFIAKYVNRKGTTHFTYFHLSHVYLGVCKVGGISVRSDLCSLSMMCRHMFLHLVFSQEECTAGVALVCHEGHVHRPVLVKLTSLSEFLPAVITGEVPKHIFVFLRLVMQEILLNGELRIAETTLENRLCSGMRLFVHPQTSMLREFLPTLVACEWFLPGVCAHVSLQVALLLTHLATHGALMPLEVAPHVALLDVVHQDFLRGIWAPAEGAGHGLLHVLLHMVLVVRLHREHLQRTRVLC